MKLNVLPSHFVHITILLLNWHNSPGGPWPPQWLSTTYFYSARSFLSFLFHTFLDPQYIIWSSSCNSPPLFVPSGNLMKIDLPLLFDSIWIICPSHLSLDNLMWVSKFGYLYISYSLELYLLIHLSSHFIATKILLRIILPEAANFVQTFWFKACSHYWVQKRKDHENHPKN